MKKLKLRMSYVNCSRAQLEVTEVDFKARSVSLYPVTPVPTPEDS